MSGETLWLWSELAANGFMRPQQLEIGLAFEAGQNFDTLDREFVVAIDAAKSRQFDLRYNGRSQKGAKYFPHLVNALRQVRIETSDEPGSALNVPVAALNNLATIPRRIADTGMLLGSVGSVSVNLTSAMTEVDLHHDEHPTKHHASHSRSGNSSVFPRMVESGVMELALARRCSWHPAAGCIESIDSEESVDGCVWSEGTPAKTTLSRAAQFRQQCPNAPKPRSELFWARTPQTPTRPGSSCACVETR
ncbi:hypothetical protein MMC08_008779 [Hypocenomyce scalaris]|nr:hypothetical protein [Hypocenomyce scalaris]